MKKHLIFSILFALFCGSTLLAQPHLGYDWTAPLKGKPVVKIATWEDGVYRVLKSDVIAIAPGLASASIDSLRLYFRGEEQRLVVYPDGNGSWSAIDFIGQYHDGGDDATLYRNNIIGDPEPSIQTHPEISLFSDTAAYFLTAHGGSPAARWELNRDLNFGASPASFIPYESVLLFHPDDLNKTTYIVSGGSAYDSFNALNSDYIVGEGYFSKQGFGQSDPRTFEIFTPLAYPGTQNIDLSFRVFARSNTTHRLRVTINDPTTVVIDTLWPSNTIYTETYERMHVAPIQDTTRLTFEALGTGPADNNHLVNARVRYARLPDMANSPFFRIPDYSVAANNGRLRLANSLGQDSVWAYAPSTGQRFAGLVQNGNAELMVKAMTSTSDLLLVTDASIKTPRIGAVSMNPLCDPDSGAQMIILTTAALETSARAYAAYKISLGISTKVVFADDVYNGFGYGTVTPLAIQRFCDCAFQRWNTTPGYLLIWADADALTRQSTSNQIPTWGFPASDHTFAAMTDPAATVREMQEPRFAVGRLPIRHDSAGFNYLQKVPVWEIQNNYDWMREAAFMGGGASVGEQSAISLGINNIMDTYGDTILGGDTTCYFQKIGADTISWPDFSCAHPAKGMRYFFGHASSNILDVNLHKIGFYEDSLKPPFMFINGCFGTDFLSENSQAERWISASDRGAAVWMGNTSAGYLSPLKTYSEIFMELFADKMIEEPIGAVMLATTRAYLDSVPGIQTRNHTRQMALLGDPSLILSRRDTSGGPDGAMWPGDTNDDQEVSVLDVLNVGLAFGQTGPTRANATLHWSPQYSDDWSTQTSAGTNLKHVDSNGDGLIDSSDVVAIGRNYAETYNKTGWGSFTVGGTPLTISHPAQVNAGDQVSLGLELGTAAQPAAGVYGLAFSLSFDSAQVAAGSWQIDISNSWLGPADSLLIFYKEIREEGKVDIAITRTDQAMVSGYGEIAQLDIVIIDDINKRWDTEFSPLLNQGTIIDNIGTRLPVSDAVETFVTPTYTSVVFPNPADESIFLLPGDNTLSDIQLLSLDGRTVAFPSFVTDRYQFDLADIRPGIYILQFREGNSMQYVKVVKR